MKTLKKISCAMVSLVISFATIAVDVIETEPYSIGTIKVMQDTVIERSSLNDRCPVETHRLTGGASQKEYKLNFFTSDHRSGDDHSSAWISSGFWVMGEMWYEFHAQFNENGHASAYPIMRMEVVDDYLVANYSLGSMSYPEMFNNIPNEVLSNLALSEIIKQKDVVELELYCQKVPEKLIPQKTSLALSNGKRVIVADPSCEKLEFSRNKQDDPVYFVSHRESPDGRFVIVKAMRGNGQIYESAGDATQICWRRPSA